MYVEARDWEEDPKWDYEGGDKTAPPGCVIGRVMCQTADTLTINRSWFPDGPTDSGLRIPIGCIEALYPVMVGRDALWAKKQRKKS